MHSIKWRYLTVTVLSVFIHSIVGFAEASDAMQKPISMTADGWKPIVGSSLSHPPNYQEEIKYYQNPILKETVRAETLPTTTPISTLVTTTGPETVTKQSVPISINLFNQRPTKGKIPPHTKQSPQYFLLPRHGGHGPHIPLNAVTQGRPGLHGVLKKGSIKGHHGSNRWIVQKPLTSQLVSSQSSRNEVYVPAPSTGSHSHLSQSKNVRTRESIGLGNPGHKLFSNKSPNSQLEYSSHFPPKNIFHQNHPVQHIFFQKQQANEIIPSYQIDTHQNLLPPPIYKNFDKNQMRHSNKHINPEIHTPNDKIIFGHNPLGPNDLILQLPTYDQSLFDFGKQKQSPSTIQVTKEKLKTFHNDIPPKFSPHLFKDSYDNFHSFQKPITEYPKSPTYEVTENKWDDNTPLPNKFQKNNIAHPVELNFPPFLPTPYKPDISISTSPTQEDVSTIFGQLSNNVKQYSDVYTHDPYLFDVKEVSTHYPILGTPGVIPTTKEFPEGATGKPISTLSTEETPTTTEVPKVETIKPVKVHNRRRRPTTRYTTTTQAPTEVITEYENTSPSSYSTDEIETERPYRSRRPMKPRPNLGNSEEVSEEVPKFNRIRDRHRKRPYHGDLRNKQHRKRVRPSKIELEEQFTTKTPKAPFQEEDITVLPIVQHFTTQNARDVEKELPQSTLRSDVQTEYVSNSDEIINTKEPYRYYSDEESNQEVKIAADDNNDVSINNKKFNYDNGITTPSHNNREEEHLNAGTLQNSEEDELPSEMNEQFKYRKVFSTTEGTLNLSTPSTSEYETESTTTGITDIHSSAFDISDISKTSTPEPTTTEISTTIKSHRRRPIKYSASNRPRFSVKDYRQRLNQYSSTTTTTETTKTSTDSVRLRFPTRLRRPLSTTGTTTQASEETTRPKFIPKEPRHGQTRPGDEEIIKEKNVKAVNTRLRPFGRVKATTEQASTVPSKVSIKPNLFFNRRRPPLIGLKSRFGNRNKTEESEVKENDLTTAVNNVDDSVELENPVTPDKEEEHISASDDEATTTPSDILKNDAVLYSQRVSDLTSSMKNAYEGFKNIPTTSRRIPNFYALSTEDPILPIEAFFSNINEKEN